MSVKGREFDSSMALCYLFSKREFLFDCILFDVGCGGIVVVEVCRFV